MADAFKNSKSQYLYDKKQKIYTVMVMLNNKPRIITVRVGDNFTEMSLADKEGNVLEMIRQEQGKGIRVNKMM